MYRKFIAFLGWLALAATLIGCSLSVVLPFVFAMGDKMFLYALPTAAVLILAGLGWMLYRAYQSFTQLVSMIEPEF